MPAAEEGLQLHQNAVTAQSMADHRLYVLFYPVSQHMLFRVLCESYVRNLALRRALVTLNNETESHLWQAC
jgi:hypothetical protein